MKNLETKHYVIGGIIISVIAIVIIFLLLKSKKNNPPEGLNNENSDSNSKNTTTTAKSEEFPLQIGSKGDLVLKLQKALNNKRGLKTPIPMKLPDPITEDGSFGKGTEERLFLLFGIKKVTSLDFNKIVYL